ncbi:30S ribosomal protein S16 [Candidatus Gracilibacteria bacterium]|nr:30S ribosomal protein S16 [Candidatus Gracilibacteria bacterium]
MLIIRLARRGRKKQAFYDIVVAEKARAVQKKYIAKLGYFNPLSENGKGKIVIDKQLVEKYIKNGAQLSQAIARLLTKNGINAAEKFIIKRATKPKKVSTKTTVTEPPVEEATKE